MPAKSLTDFLLSIRAKPKLHLGNGGVRELFHQLMGYRQGIMDSGAAVTADWAWLDGFHSFVAEHFDFKSDFGWSSIIWLWSFESQSASLDLFFKLWDDYAASISKVSSKRRRWRKRKK